MVRAANSAAIRRGEEKSINNSTNAKTSNSTTLKTYGGRISFLKGTEAQIKDKIKSEVNKLRAKEEQFKSKSHSGKNKSKYRKKYRAYRDRRIRLQRTISQVNDKNLQDTSWRASVLQVATGNKDWDKAKRQAAYSFAERQERGAKLAGQRAEEAQIRSESGLTKEEMAGMNAASYRAVRDEYRKGNLRRAGTPPKKTKKGAYSATIEGKKFVGTKEFISDKIKGSENKFYTSRWGEAQALTNQGYTAKDFFPQKTTPRNVLLPTDYGLQTLTKTPEGKRRRLTPTEIKQFGYERQAEKISQQQEDFFTSPRMKAIERMGSRLSQPFFKNPKAYENRGFIGKTSETLLTGAMSAPIAAGAIIATGTQKTILGAKIALNGGAKDVAQEAFIGAPKEMEKTSFSFLPGGTPITPEGAATGLTIAAGTVALGYSMQTARVAPPRTTAPKGNINLKGVGGSATITSENLIPTPKTNTVTKITYASRTKGLFPKKVSNTVRISNTGSVKTQVIGKNTYTQVFQGKTSLVTKTSGGKLLGQANLKNLGGRSEGVGLALTRSTTKNTIKNFADRPNQLISRTNTVSEFDVYGRLNGKRIKGIFDAESMGEVKVFASPAKGVLRENVFEKNLATGNKRLAGSFKEETFLPIKLTPGNKGESFPKVFSKSQQTSGGLRIGDDGTIYSRVTTRTRTADLNIRLKTRTEELGFGQAAKDPYIIDSLKGFARNKKGSVSLEKPRFVKSSRSGRLAPTEEVLKPRRPEIIKVGRPGLKGGGFKPGFRQIPNVRTASIIAPVFATIPRQTPKKRQSQIPRQRLTTLPDTTKRFDFRTTPRVTPIQDSIFRTTPRAPTTFTPFTPFTPTTRPPSYRPPVAGSPPPLIPLPFGFGFGGGGFGKSGTAFASKRKFGYAPDLPSIDLKIFGKTKTPRGGFTGFEHRRLRL